jgi:hypothetical protein
VVTLQNIAKILFHLLLLHGCNRLSGDKDQVDGGFELVLHLPIGFPHQTPGPIPDVRFSDFFTGNDSQSGKGPILRALPIRNQATMHPPASFVPDTLEFGAVPDSLVLPKSFFLSGIWNAWPSAIHAYPYAGVRRLRPDRRRAFRMPRPLLVRMRLRKPC